LALTIVLVVEYDGTDFRGFARQPGERTVQGTLLDAIARVEGPDLELHGAGRTDAGAHARGQVVDFVARLPIKPRDWKRILNRSLPPDVRVRAARSAGEGFHARFSACSREYRYTFLNRREPSVFLGRFAYYEPRPLDVAKMREAAVPLVGEHDFRALTQEPEGGRHAVRRVYRAEVGCARPYVRFAVEANAFLRGMVRMMAGALWEVGLGKREPEHVAGLLAEPGAARKPPVMPAHGLCLMRVRYGDDARATEDGDEE
jgi:tRNA pseudouridine38-40 synthase